MEISRSFGAIGVNAAHSGTVIGVMFDPCAGSDIDGCVEAICRECEDVSYFRTVRMVSGGLSVLEAPKA